MLLLLLVFAAAVPAAMPLIWIVVSSLRLGDEGAPWSAFAEVAAAAPLWQWLLNGLLIAGGQTVLAVVFCSLAAFAVTSYRFVGRSVILVVLVATALLPGPAAITGLFEVVAKLGGVDTYWAATLPGAFSVIGLFLFAAAMRSTPRSVMEAARLDGCGELRLWWDIALPIVRPATSAFVLLHFLAAWNALLWPTAILADESKRPIAAGLAGVSKSVAFEADVSLPLTATLLSLVPVMLLFAACGRDILRRPAAD